MPYIKLSENLFDCNTCPTRCDGNSKLNYQFGTDLEFAEIQENLIIEKINKNGQYTASKCEIAGYPDIEIRNLDGSMRSYLEVKAQRRTFMSVNKLLPESNLKPSETVVLNLSDLKRYFEIEAATNIPTSIVWVVMNRPCIVPTGSQKFYFQTTNELNKIYKNFGDKRRFKRNSGEGDVVNGKHKGVVVNYHFSINELREWKVF